ncbi:MAG: alpha-2-macroglobulin family protein, partial [Gemmatimonadaceae bacterium]
MHMIAGRRLAALALLSSAPFFLPAGPDPLHVLRALPNGTVGPNAQVRVTFDRPVAGSLDYTVDPARVLRLSPAAAGTLAWRDPVTVVFTPSRPYAPATDYTVTVDTTFHAMDGARLEQPYTFSFRVSGPQLIGGSPVSPGSSPTDLRPNAKFDLVWSSPVDAERVAAASYVELSRSCTASPGGIVRLRALGAGRPIADSDDWMLHNAGGSPRDRGADSLRRVVSLTPATPLPLACAAELVSRAELDSTSTTATRWSFATYGPLMFSKATCAYDRECPTGPLILYFTTPVRGSELRKKVTIIPATAFTMSDTSRESNAWQLDAELKPRTRYAVVVDTGLRDTFGQRLTGNPAQGLETSSYAPSVRYPYGRMLVERDAFGTLAVQHVNVDTLVVTAAPVPDSLESRFLRSSVWSWQTLWKELESTATGTRVPVRRAVDHPMITGVKLPVVNSAGHRGLVAVRIGGPAGVKVGDGEPIALVQVTDLGVHVKLGAASGVVWVTRVSSGAAVSGATVTVRDGKGKALASGRTDARGLATFAQIIRAPASGDATTGEYESPVPDSYVEATLGDDRALVGVSEYDPDLSPWNFGVSGAWGSQALPIAAAVFTERGIYRPGEPLYAKAILRRGSLGALVAPAGRDSVRIVFRDRDGANARQRVIRLTAFGTAADEYRVPADAKLGYYTVALEYHWQGRWVEVGQSGYRVAEYRPPEFLVDVTGPKRSFFGGDSVTAGVEARYLFGAPMARAAVEWEASRTPVSWWELEIPGLADGEWYIGESGWWWEEDEGGDQTTVTASGTDTLDATGRLTLRAATPPAEKGQAARMTMTASVTDVNRQVVSSSTSVIVHPAAFYIAAKPAGDSYFWRAGAAQSVGIIAVRPDGTHVPGVAVSGSIVRREWHQVHRERDGAAEVVGEWVSDTVARCALTTRTDPVPCAFTPGEGGMYVVAFTARDPQRREARTSLTRWASGSDWVPWEDESRFKMDVIADKSRYAVGDTASVMLASPFTGAEAWVTVEREGIIEQRRMTLTSGSTVLKFPITEAFVPNAYVSVVVTRGRSAAPGTLDDPGRPTMRVGYAQLRVTPEVKRLAVTVRPLAAEYRPADSARIALHVSDARGAGQRAEVALWAVDEGVLALTGYKTPDPIDLLYRERGLGLRLASNLVSVAPQIPEGEKGRREPGGGGGNGAADVLRSRFKTTAFFLGSVVTDVQGNVTAVAKLPDNLTTFRVMAVAVTAGDRYGSGDAKMLVTRPLVARPALPRFVRPGDDFTAGAVVNRRSGAPGPVTVSANVSGIETHGDSTQRAQLEQGRGVEVRFPFRARSNNAGDQGDSAVFRFTVSSGADGDAVQAKLPFRPDYHPRAYTASGVLRDTASVELIVPKGIDPARSRVDFSLGGSVLSLVRGAYDRLRVYPWYCTEQVTSSGRPLLALYQARANAGIEVPPNAKTDIEMAVRMLSSRQRDDGGIGYWGSDQWTTPWLTAYAGEFLVDARAAGITVSDSVLAHIAEYLARELKADSTNAPSLRRWYYSRANVLADRVAIVDLLGRLHKPDIAAENRLLAQAAQLRPEDRARLAEVLARRGELRTAAGLLASQWAAVRIEGRRAVLPDSVFQDTTFYFASSVRPAARLLLATLAVAPDHPLVGPLVENMVQQGRAARGSWWNTLDWGLAVQALTAFDRKQQPKGASSDATLRVRSGGRLLFTSAITGGAAADSSAPLSGLLTDAPDGAQALRLQLERTGTGAQPIYYYVTVHEVP